MSERKHVSIFTDGACVNNPGPGGYAAVLIHRKYRKELSGGFRHTTNNRMEIMAAIVALRALKSPCDVTLYSDSRYLVDSIMKGWARRWRDNGWKRNRKEHAVNCDLWQELLELCSIHTVRFQWVPGHAGVVENERCDWLSVQATQEENLPCDEGYERPSSFDAGTLFAQENVA